MSNRPLVVVTRDDGPASRFASALSARGLEPFGLPMIAIRPAPDRAALDAALRGLQPADWLVFTSAHAVAAVVERPDWRRARSDGRFRIAVVGEATALELARSGIAADVVAEQPGAAGLVAALERAASLRGVRVVWPRSDRARHHLAEQLAALGARVVEVIAYRAVTIAPDRTDEFTRLLGEGRIGAVAFLSPSSAEGLAAALGAGDLRMIAGRAKVASIGPTTTATLRDLGAPPEIEARAASAEALADEIARRLTTALVGASS